MTLPELTPMLTPISRALVGCRPALYGGGAGVIAGLAVLGGGSGGRWVLLLRRYGLPYVALYRGSMLGAFIRDVSVFVFFFHGEEIKVEDTGGEFVYPEMLVMLLLFFFVFGEKY